MKLKEVLDKSIQFFKEKKLDTPRLDAEFLIAHALKLDRMQLYMKYEAPLSELEVSQCREAIRRRSQGEPAAYITGEKGFYGFVFKVGAGVLIPRPETEHLVEESLEFIKEKKLLAPRILDLGAGSGCIGFSILKNCPEATLVSVENSAEAARYWKENCELLGLYTRSELIFQSAIEIDESKMGRFDIIVANPPYISSADTAVEANVKKFEPAAALFADNGGLSLLSTWSKKFSANLKPTSLMVFEMGYLQGPDMVKAFTELQIFKTVSVAKDLSGLDRIIKGARY